MVHLIVLVHGLWGSPAHMQYIGEQIETTEKKLLENPEHTPVIIYKTGSHSHFLTYDGIDINGKRIRDEIMEEVNRLSNAKQTVTKFSIVGYSLGGLIARYCIGILYNEGFFDNIEPINFVSLCTPHVGVMNPLSGFKYRMANSLSPYFIGITGAQLFLRDKVRGRPLLVEMADPRSIFYNSLKQFKKRTLYSNVMNDKRTFWYTAGISLTDKFLSMSNTRAENLHVLYIDNEVLIDLTKPITCDINKVKIERSLWSYITIFGKLMLFPIWALHFAGVSLLERVKLGLRVRSFLKGTQLDHLYIEEMDHEDSLLDSVYNIVAGDSELNLNDNQKFIIGLLNLLGWEKFPLLISLTAHAHAAAIVRHGNPKFEEGKVVVKHLVNVTLLLT